MPLFNLSNDRAVGSTTASDVFSVTFLTKLSIVEFVMKSVSHKLRYEIEPRFFQRLFVSLAISIVYEYNFLDCSIDILRSPFPSCKFQYPYSISIKACSLLCQTPYQNSCVKLHKDRSTFAIHGYKSSIYHGSRVFNDELFQILRMITSAFNICRAHVFIAVREILCELCTDVQEIYVRHVGRVVPDVDTTKVSIRICRCLARLRRTFSIFRVAARGNGDRGSARYCDLRPSELNVLSTLVHICLFGLAVAG